MSRATLATVKALARKYKLIVTENKGACEFVVFPPKGCTFGDTTSTVYTYTDPYWRQDTIEEMLFNSLYNAGMSLLDEDRFEEGVFYLDQAVALRPLDEEALTQRRWAVQYMTALGYWGVDWELCIERFTTLYQEAPNYKDVSERLYQAHTTYADAWYDEGEMCPAEEQYTLALQIIYDTEIEQLRDEATAACAIATPTPIAPIDGQQVITLTELPPGFNAGSLAYPVYNTQTGLYDIYTLSTDLIIARRAANAYQPAWMWGNRALGYRDRLSGGIALQVLGEATPRSIIATSGASWPTFSPDNTRVAYAVQDAGGRWQIYIAPVDGSSEPQAYAPGQCPVWGPTGLLAWNGCQNGVCGIYLDNPDDDQDPLRVSDSTDDIGLSWSPDGGMIAYMSDFNGNWDIYLYSLSGGFEILVEDPASDGLPAWSPDVASIAFVSNRDGNWGLYITQRNGEDPHKIVTLSPNMPEWTQQRLSWSP